MLAFAFNYIRDAGSNPAMQIYFFYYFIKWNVL